jgi:hypothetical protein
MPAIHNVPAGRVFELTISDWAAPWVGHDVTDILGKEVRTFVFVSVFMSGLGV